MSTENLAAALVAFQSEIPTVGKGKTADTGKYTYTYADLASVSAAAMPLLTSHGLAFHTAPRLVEGGAYELVGILRHTSGETVEGALPLFGRTPQELGSAMTYARRYLLGCMTGIVTEDDDDGARAQHSQGQTRRQEPPPDPMHVARVAVRDAWEATRGEFDQTAMRLHYEDYAALPLIEATPADLHAYAAHLTGASA